jgi:hypothetical protein
MLGEGSGSKGGGKRKSGGRKRESRGREARIGDPLSTPLSY